MSSVAGIHGCKAAAVLAALAPESEVVAKLIGLMRALGQKALTDNDLRVGVACRTMA